MMRRVKDWIRNRFPFLHWPLSHYANEVDLTAPSQDLDRHVAASRHSLRLQRYWWAARAIADEAKRRNRQITVVDLGCERGWLKRFVPRDCNVRWVGLDGILSNPSLAASNYDETIEANFNGPLPVPSASADVVVSLHVFEHLEDPTHTAGEVARILKPDGLFLVGTPVSMPLLAKLRTRMHTNRHLAGKNVHWAHLRKFSPATWSDICQTVGLRVQFLTGSHLIRKTGFKLENYPWWIRLNQLWGSLFPSLGQEVYIAARKASPAPARVPIMQKFWARYDWAAPLAVVAVLGAVAYVSIGATTHSLADEIARHQDGNDIFKLCPMSQLNNARVAGNLPKLGSVADIDSQFADYQQRGLDLHVVIHQENITTYLNTPHTSILRVADEWTNDGQKYLVISQEPEHMLLTEWAERAAG